MQNDFTLITHAFDDTIVVCPISDVHFGSIEHNAKAWREFVELVLGTPNLYLILNGDMINNATRSSVSNIFEEKYRPSEQKKIMAEMLEPIKDRILASTTGNHEARSGKDVDDDPMYDIMCKLGIEDFHRENTAFVKIQIGKRTGEKKSNQTYVICATHGAGGGALTGSAVNKNERFLTNFEGVDALVVGHTHKGSITRPTRIVVDPRNNTITKRDLLTVTSPSWMEYGGYALRKMLAPSSSCRPQYMVLENIPHQKPKNIKVIWS